MNATDLRLLDTGTRMQVRRDSLNASAVRRLTRAGLLSKGTTTDAGRALLRAARLQVESEARTVAEALAQNTAAFLGGLVSYEAFGDKNRALWSSVEGLASEAVNAILRNDPAWFQAALPPPRPWSAHMTIRFFHVHNLPPVFSVIASDELEARAVARAWLTPEGHGRTLALLRAYYPEDGRQAWSDAIRDLDPIGHRRAGLEDRGFPFEVVASFLPGRILGYQTAFGAYDLEHAELIARRLSRVEGVQGVAIFERMINGSLQVWREGECVRSGRALEAC